MVYYNSSNSAIFYSSSIATAAMCGSTAYTYDYSIPEQVIPLLLLQLGGEL